VFDLSAQSSSSSTTVNAAVIDAPSYLASSETIGPLVPDMNCMVDGLGASWVVHHASRYAGFQLSC
jgi:hypothetical protein